MAKKRKKKGRLPREEKRSGFCAHVYSPGDYLLVFIMIVAFILGCGIWSAVVLWEPVTAENTQNYEVTFTAWQVRDEDLVLTATQMQEPFVIDSYQKYSSGFQELTAGCDGSRSFSAWGIRVDPDDSEPYFRVYALSSGETVYRSFADSTACKRQELPLVVGIFGGLLAFILAFSAFIYAVGSNPGKFPKWVVYLCFKKTAIDI